MWQCGRIIVRAENDILIPLSRKLRNHIVWLSVILILSHLKSYILNTIFYKTYSLARIYHGTQKLLCLSHNSLTQIPLLNVLVRIVNISVLEQYSLCPCLDKILVCEKWNTAHIQQNYLVLRSGYWYLVQTRHIIQLTLNRTASAAGKCLTLNLRTVRIEVCLLNIAHGNAEIL